MDLYIVRHGEAGLAPTDAARALTERGRAEVEQVAAALERRSASVRQIRHSGRERARETAEILATRLDPPAGLIQTDGLHPDDPVEPIAMSLFGERESLMLVGHLPFVGRLVGLLTTGDANRCPVNFPTSTVACLRGEDDRWEIAWTEHPS
ncbi:MAG: phosphohistidine phosphatase SixA [bacterium]|nr:phosphohistidine phosphatase SixA [bacterium]MCP5045310.1 phosphohistidine phosphatase SixA [bacterium]